jgi:hypothetical protein
LRPWPRIEAIDPACAAALPLFGGYAADPLSLFFEKELLP